MNGVHRRLVTEGVGPGAALLVPHLSKQLKPILAEDASDTRLVPACVDHRSQ